MIKNITGMLQNSLVLGYTYLILDVAVYSINVRDAQITHGEK